ncbi:MAG: hypothetical protein GXO87_07995 [Chlorobi bacterium]|nr:hypothetical protein [Chlorobiota bacterium]
MSREIQNNKLIILGKLLAGITHEIRNPLSAIELELESINLSEQKLEPEITESLKACKEATERIKNIIESTLEFSRRETRGASSHSLNGIAEQTLDLLSAAARKKNVALIRRFGKNLPKIVVNKNKILQATINLVNNGIEACSKGGAVKIQTSVKKDGTVKLDVIDNGVGIGKENFDQIFSDFYTNKKGGTGLGLSVCKAIIADQKASIKFTSKLGEGSRFTIEFPVSLREDSYGSENTNN